MRRALRGLAAVVLTAVASGAAARPWYVHYGRGLDLLEQGDPAGAERELREALARRPASACRARIYGVRFREYVPRYELARALTAQGREAEAAVELSRELAAGVIDACPATQAQAMDLRQRLAALVVEPAPQAVAQAPPALPAVALPSEAAAATAPDGAPPEPPGASAPAAAAQGPPMAKPAAAAAVPAPRLPPPLLGVAWSPSSGLPAALLPPARP